MKLRPLHLFLFTIFVLSLTRLNSYGQCQQLSDLIVINPSFEGPTGPHITPAPWNTCGLTPDTQPGSWGVTLLPSEGNSYVGFVYGGANWQEGASQELSGPMSIDVTYGFTIDLSATPTTLGGIDSSSHCAMEVWGASDNCTEQELLWTSPVITHIGWETYNVSFTPTQDYTHIYFKCDGELNGYILLDNISEFVADIPNVAITSHNSGDTITCGVLLEGSISDAIIDSVVLIGNFQESPLTASLNNLDWSGMVSFLQPGDQTVTATAFYTDQSNNEDICVYTEVELVLTSSSTASFSSLGQCQGMPIEFTDSSTPFDTATIVGWQWDFGAGNSSSNQNPTHIFNSDGVFSVTLAVTSTDGCTSTSVQNIEIVEGPIADFDFTLVCQGSETEFSDSSTADTGTVVMWQWDFGDGTNSDIQNPSHPFQLSGLMDVELVATTNLGCSDTVQHSIFVNSVPIAAFNVPQICLSHPALFEDASTVANGAYVVDWLWSFGDGNNSITENPQYVYADTGLYQVVLSVISSDGCEDSVSQEIEVLLCTGVEEVAVNSRISIFPNPVSRSIGLEVASGEQPITVTVVESTGRLIKKVPFSSTIDVSNLDAGVYFFRVQFEDGQESVQRFVKISP